MKTWAIKLSYPNSGEVREIRVEAKTKTEATQKLFRRKKGAEMLSEYEGNIEIEVTEVVEAPVAEDYTREILIGLCEDAFPPMSSWFNRDSYSAMSQLGVAFALLKCNVPFRVKECDAKIIWLEFFDIEGFQHCESAEHEGDQFYDTESAYVPTRLRLEEADGKDWY